MKHRQFTLFWDKRLVNWKTVEGMALDQTIQVVLECQSPVSLLTMASPREGREVVHTVQLQETCGEGQQEGGRVGVLGGRGVCISLG